MAMLSWEWMKLEKQKVEFEGSCIIRFKKKERIKLKKKSQRFQDVYIIDRS